MTAPPQPCDGASPPTRDATGLEARLRHDAARLRARPLPDLTERVRRACAQSPRGHSSPAMRRGRASSALLRDSRLAAAAVLLLVGAGMVWTLGLWAPTAGSTLDTTSGTRIVAEGAWIDVERTPAPDRSPALARPHAPRAAIEHLVRGDGEPPLVWQHLRDADLQPVVSAHVDQPLLAEARGLGRDAGVAASFFADRLTAPLRMLQGLLTTGP